MVSITETMVCKSETTVCVPQAIASVPGTIVSVAEKIDSWTVLIADEVEILRSQSSTITDDVEVIVLETELIVTRISSKGKTVRKEAGRTRMSDVKQSVCLVWIVVSPFMPPYKASRVPFLTR